jgi:5-methylcytosine-specific restriction endonuclease McrA
MLRFWTTHASGRSPWATEIQSQVNSTWSVLSVGSQGTEPMMPKITYIGKVKVERIKVSGSDYDVVKLLPAENEPSTTKSLYMQPGWYTGDAAPLRCGNGWPNVWIYKRQAFRVEAAADCDPEEVAVRIEHLVLKTESEYERIKAEVAARKKLEQVPPARRERIPESVQKFVWQRDQGRCCQCGSRERLEFDHIIPVAEGGSSTGRNIQLLSEPCNRKKGKRVGY